jgi:cytochrome P450 family 142 subfamily A polypeptide 1
MPNHPVRDDIDLLDGHWYATEPHDDWTWMREHAPVYYDANSDVWAITKYDDVLAIEKDAKGFSSYKAPRPHGEPLPMMISMDNPLHQRRRSLVYHGFTPKRVAEHEVRIRAICNEIVDRVCERGECDFVWDIAAPLPLLLIADMLGFEPSAYDDLLRWSDDLIRATTAEPTPEIQAASLEASLGFRAMQLEVIKDRRSKPQGDDLVSLLCYAEIEGEKLDDESIVQETLLILIGGDETTRHVITGGQLALFEHPDQWKIMRDDPSTMVSGTEEMLRWISPIKNMARTVVNDVEIRGETLHAGDQVILMYPSANRDADEFPEPFTFDVKRDPNHHLAFGFGPHYCLGQALARLELQVMFDVLFRRLPDLEPANEEPLPYRASNFIVGPEAMPVRFTPTEKLGARA